MEALSNPQIGHRTPEISDMINRIILGIQQVLYTKNHIYLVSHAATGLWEMGIINSVDKGILHAVNGAFSLKWASISKLCGKDLGIIEYEWGRGISVEDVDDYLKTGKYNVFAMVHNETSTGVMSDLESISELLKSKYPDVIWLVDAVSSMAGVKIEVDRLGIDMILASTQKAWGLPAGFSICSVSERLVKSSEKMKNKGYFLDICTYEKYYNKYQTPTTPSIPHLHGLQKILEIIDKEGLENRWSRHIEMSEYTMDWAYNHNQGIFPEEGCRSHTLTCIHNKNNWDLNVINDELLKNAKKREYLLKFTNIACLLRTKKLNHFIKMQI